tara:strand:+ start:1254 stop:1511 length:258 start_codon:yes stop_codon:yes gene_type:complete
MFAIPSSASFKISSTEEAPASRPLSLPGSGGLIFKAGLAAPCNLIAFKGKKALALWEFLLPANAFDDECWIILNPCVDVLLKLFA